ncbi:MAG: hypothetical protein H0X72_03805 [Acidobacteria bacterium]|nr:hypothetical protein [Acidobacteriota bacterium]
MSNRFSKSRELLIKNEKEKNGEPGGDSSSKEVSIKSQPEDTVATAEKTIEKPKKSKAKGIEFNMSIPLVLKNLRIPIEFELAIKELKSRRNAARPITREKLITEEAIIVEALEHYFLEPGLNSQTLNYILNDKMNYLKEVGRAEQYD